VRSPISEGNVKRSRGRDPHEVRARERFTFPEGPTRVQVDKERKPLPLVSLSPCLPVNLVGLESHDALNGPR